MRHFAAVFFFVVLAVLAVLAQQLLPKIGVDCGKCGQRGVVADNDGDMPSNQSDNCFLLMLIDDLQSSVWCVYCRVVCVCVCEGV